MPSTDAPRRPTLSHRHSLGSGTFARSPSDGLPGSLRGQKNIKFAVGQGRVGPRVSSHGKNLNRLSKLNTGRPANNAPTSPKQQGGAGVKRNISSGELVQNHSAVNLRKNQSETSLKRNNRSSGQLAKLTRPNSSRNVAKTHKRPQRSDRADSATNKAHAHDFAVAPSVRFDLGHNHDDREEPELSGEEREEEGAWENYTDSRSPSTTRASTPRPNSIMASPHKPDRHNPEGNDEPPEQKTTKPEAASQPSPRPSDESIRGSISSLHSDSRHAQNHRARTPHADNIASRLLKRNSSFNSPALAQLSSNAATPVLIGNHHHHHVSAGSINDGSNPELVSRFLSTTSTSTTPHSTFIPSSSNSPEKDWRREKEQLEDEGIRRNKSLSDVPAMRVSRTQQKLNLERESVAREPKNGNVPPLSILRSSRLSNANIPFYEIGDEAADGQLHPQLRHLFEQTSNEYRRTRMFQNPLASAIKRLEEDGAVPSRSISTRQKPSKGRVGILSGSGDGAYGLSQSWRSHRSSKSADAKYKATSTPFKEEHTNGHARRPRVMFQGINTKDEERISDGRHSLDGQRDSDERDSVKSQRDEVRELCRRLWNKRETVGSDE